MSPLKRVSGLGSQAGRAASRGRWLARGATLLAVAEVLVAVRDHLSERLTERDRRRLVEIVRTSRGRPSNLSDRERRELRELIGKAEPGVLARRAASTSLAGRGRRRR